MNERIKQIRKSLKLTQAEMGARLGIANNTIACYESGLRVPSTQVITSICREFNVNEEWLLNGTGEMFNELTTSELAAKLVGQIITSKDEFVINTLIAVASLKPEQWDSIKEFVEKLKGE